MGTINYNTSDYITMGIKPYDTDDFIKDNEFMEFIKNEWNVDITDKNTVYNAINDEIEFCYKCDCENIETELNKHYFYYYRITIKPGYYEGFSIDIENNFPVALDNWQERKDANKEITEIKQFLINCAGLGLVQCSPGWITSYNDYNGTIKAINAAIKEMRAELKTIPTWSQYERGGVTA